VAQFLNDMKKEDIHLSDWQRILLGEAPALFMLEVLLRTVLIYLVLLVVVRLLGKRMSGQLTQTEIAVMVTLGAIVSPAMQLPDRGVLASVLTLAVILTLFRAVNRWGVGSHRVEHLAHGTEGPLVKDGVLQLDELRRHRISHQQLLTALRTQQVYSLGRVSRVYLEPSGDFSIYTTEEARPGLSTLPQTDDDIHRVLQPVDDALACCNCGTTVPARGRPQTTCPACHQQTWDSAYL